MKRLVELTVEDLVASPVWRYEGGSGREALVVPVKRKALSREDDEIFLAATEFELFDSSRHSGFCFPADDSGIDYLQPVVVSGPCHVNFWFDRRATPEVLDRQWTALGKKAQDIFPVDFRCLIPVDGRTVTGRIAGVATSEDLTSGPAAPAISEVSTAAGRADVPATSAPDADRIPTARPVQARRDTGPVEKRTVRRRKAEMPVEFTDGTFHGTGVTGDVSPRGVFVRSTHVLPSTGPMLRLTVNLPEGRNLVLTGRVVRGATGVSPCATTSGFGLRLADEWPNYQDLFSRRDKRK